MEKKSDNLVINQAAQWYARLQAPDCSLAEREAFNAWIEADLSRRQAYESVSSAASLISAKLSEDPRMRALISGALLQPEQQHDEDEGIELPAIQPTQRNSATHQPKVITQENFSRNAALGNAALGSHRKKNAHWVTHFRNAAALVIGVSVAIFLATYGEHRSSGVIPVESYANNELAKKRIDLNDGSVVYLDVGAQLTVSMSPNERRLQLESGRALFEVAHDASRPFSVSNAGMQVVALGTRFQVEVEPKNQLLNVTLAEGSVSVTNANSNENWREVLTPGQQLVIDDALHRHQILKVNAESVISWSKGMLVFDGTSLRKALDEFNRYTDTKVVLGDSSLADIPIAGSFIAGEDSTEFVESLTAVLPLRSARTGANEIVLFEKYDIQSP